MNLNAPAADAATERSCEPMASITKSLLAYGVIAGPFYVALSLVQALTRDGFDLTRHPWSLLSNGELGWLQITNFVLTGIMVLAFAVGLRRVLSPGVASAWAPRLMGVYGGSLIGAGVLRADPAMGFPAGTPAGPAAVSWHGLGHLLVGAIGFLCLIVACFVLARRFARDGRRGLALYSGVTGVVFLAGFVGIASGAGSTGTTLAFVGAVVWVWAWIATIATCLYRVAARSDS
jgi:hypothetical membrane protein